MKRHIFDFLSSIRDLFPFLDDWGFDYLRYRVFWPDDE